MTHKQIKRHIRSFLRNHYTDQRLAELGAHAQDGKFNALGCCCLIGAVNSPHALTGGSYLMCGGDHFGESKRLAGAVDAELAIVTVYLRAGMSGAGRVLSSMCRAEMRRRDRRAIEERAAAVPAQEIAAALVSKHMVAK